MWRDPFCIPNPTGYKDGKAGEEDLCSHMELVTLESHVAPLTEWAASPGLEQSSFLYGFLSFCGFFEMIDDYYGRGECFFSESKAHKEYHMGHIYFDLK